MQFASRILPVRRVASLCLAFVRQCVCQVCSFLLDALLDAKNNAKYDNKRIKYRQRKEGLRIQKPSHASSGS